MITTSRAFARMAAAAAFTALTVVSSAQNARAGEPFAPGVDRNPMGQATYLKIISGSRTSSMVRSGELRRTTMGHDTAAQAYQLSTYCKIDVRFMGIQEGTASSNAPELFFTGGFIDNLRAGQILETPDLKMKHMGFLDVTNVDGHQYAGADDIMIYDINTAGDGGGFGLNCLATMLKQAGHDMAVEKGLDVDDKAGIENLVVRVVLHPGAPVLGEVKLDATGVYNGMNVKVGGDYMAP